MARNAFVLVLIVYCHEDLGYSRGFFYVPYIHPYPAVTIGTFCIVLSRFWR
jgi:hypothetical protein